MVSLYTFPTTSAVPAPNFRAKRGQWVGKGSSPCKLFGHLAVESESGATNNVSKFAIRLGPGFVSSHVERSDRYRLAGFKPDIRLGVFLTRATRAAFTYALDVWDAGARTDAASISVAYAMHSLPSYTDLRSRSTFDTMSSGFLNAFGKCLPSARTQVMAVRRPWQSVSLSLPAVGQHRTMSPRPSAVFPGAYKCGDNDRS